jgi:uncharacterized protein YutE (UPF0331/DUF86 family)
LLDKQVANLEERLPTVNQAQFEEDWGLRAMSERAVQVMAEIMIDVAERIIALKNAGPVATAADAMDRLVQLRVIAAADTYRQIVRFRNLIVHHYEEVDPALLYGNRSRGQPGRGAFWRDFLLASRRRTP